MRSVYYRNAIDCPRTTKRPAHQLDPEALSLNVLVLFVVQPFLVRSAISRARAPGDTRLTELAGRVLWPGPGLPLSRWCPSSSSWVQACARAPASVSFWPWCRGLEWLTRERCGVSVRVVLPKGVYVKSKQAGTRAVKQDGIMLMQEDGGAKSTTINDMTAHSVGACITNLPLALHPSVIIVLPSITIHYNPLRPPPLTNRPAAISAVREPPLCHDFSVQRLHHSSTTRSCRGRRYHHASSGYDVRCTAWPGPHNAATHQGSLPPRSKPFCRA